MGKTTFCTLLLLLGLGGVGQALASPPPDASPGKPDADPTLRHKPLTPRRPPADARGDRWTEHRHPERGIDRVPGPAVPHELQPMALPKLRRLRQPRSRGCTVIRLFGYRIPLCTWDGRTNPFRSPFNLPEDRGLPERH